MDDRETIRRVRNGETCGLEAPAKIVGDAGIDIESAELWQGGRRGGRVG